MIDFPCNDCDCGNYRNCKLREPRDLTPGQRIAVWIAGIVWACAVVMLLTKGAP